MIDNNHTPVKFAVIGEPIAHSLSPLIHQQFAKQSGIALQYDKFQVSEPEAPKFIRQFFAAGGKGLNITAPCKQQAYAIADIIMPTAKRAMAANTLGINPDGKLWAANTDGVGLINDLAAKKISITNKNILILGAGGAVRGILPNILEQQPAAIVIANRTVSKAQQIITELESSKLDVCELTNIPEQSYDLIINSLPVSKFPDLPLSLQTIAYDLCYAKPGTATAFQQHAITQGIAIVHHGIGMLWQQAAESFYLWHKIRPMLANLF